MTFYRCQDGMPLTLVCQRPINQYMAQAMRDIGDLRADYGYMQALARQKSGVEQARAVMNERVAERRKNLEIILHDPARVAQGYEEIARAHGLGGSDLEPVIEQLAQWEESIQKDQRTLRKVVAAAEREARRLNAAVLPVLRDGERQYAAMNDQLAKECRDARWKLMALRAEYQPSEPEGAILGEHTDLDEYLRSLG